MKKIESFINPFLFKLLQLAGTILFTSNLLASAQGQPSSRVGNHTLTRFAPSLSDTTLNNNQKILAFREWKIQQIAEAKRTLEKMTHSTPSATEETKTEEPSNDSMTELAPSNRIKVAKNFYETKKSSPRKGLRTAYEELQYAHDLGVDDYIAVYLTKYQDEPYLLKNLIHRLNPQETLELMQALIKEKTKKSNLTQETAVNTATDRPLYSSSMNNREDKNNSSRQ